jgi:hypothetical protein
VFWLFGTLLVRKLNLPLPFYIQNFSAPGVWKKARAKQEEKDVKKHY